MLHKSILARFIVSALFLGTVVAMSQPVQFNFRSVDVSGASGTIAFGINPKMTSWAEMPSAPSLTPIY
jgi:hypothetical protein